MRKMTSTAAKSTAGSGGSNVHIASVTRPRSIAPIPICKSVQPQIGQGNSPIGATDDPRPRRQPDQIAGDAQQPRQSDHPIDPCRQVIDGACSLRRVRHGAAEEERIAEPECHSRDEGDLGDVDDGQAPERVDAQPDQPASQDRGAKIVADRGTREARQRDNRIRHRVPADRAQREQIVEGQHNVAGDHERAGDREFAD